MLSVPEQFRSRAMPLHASRWVARAFVAALCVGSMAFTPTPTNAQPTGGPSGGPDPSGIEFATIGAVGNAPWTGGGRLNNRGSVNYEYKIGKYEVTTAQWAEFFNAAFDRPANERIQHVQPPSFWGGSATQPTTPGGLRWQVPTGNEMRAVGGITWRIAAIYCNWLHNDKRTDRAAFLSGAYDVNTFGYTPGGQLFTDQLTRSPGAKYWIPSDSEWVKASHYDPNRLNQDGTTGGWWRYSNSSDILPTYGPPGVNVLLGTQTGPDPNGPLAQANSNWDDFRFPGYNPFTTPLGAYAVTTPWGLLDAAGGTSEWTERAFFSLGEPLPRDRGSDGSAWFQITNGSPDDAQTFGTSGFPDLPSFLTGLRIAAAVPSPGASSLVIGCVVYGLRRRRS